MQVGYARASTIDQEAGFRAQLKALMAAGCEKVFSEQVSSVAQRPQLEGLIICGRVMRSSSPSLIGWLAALRTSWLSESDWTQRV